MDADLDTLATALYVKTDDLLKAHPEQGPYRPKVGFAPEIMDAEIITLAVMGAVLGFDNERAVDPIRTWASTGHVPRATEPIRVRQTTTFFGQHDVMADQRTGR
jgi:hypothetical protein